MHLYLHVPFCARRCSYCDFAIAVRRNVPSAEFAARVEAEWDAWQAAPWWEQVGPIETIYFGGGTPSRLDPLAIERLLDAIRSRRPVSPDVEITVEANPEDVDASLAAAWGRAGVNRVSLGVQSFDPRVLEWMHRVHGPDQPARAVAALREGGIANLSVDLIYAVPDSLERDWRADFDRALGLEPEHLSLYGLTVEARTPLGHWVDRGAVNPAPEARAADEYLEANMRLQAAGFEHYEVSNAGRPGRHSRHNFAYWRRAAYLGLGPSAHSAVGNHRWWNVRDWAKFRTLDPGGAVAGEEHLTPDQVRLEELYLGLRTRLGVAASMLPENVVHRWAASGWASRVGSQVVLTPDGWLRLDALVTQAAGA